MVLHLNAVCVLFLGRKQGDIALFEGGCGRPMTSRDQGHSFPKVIEASASWRFPIDANLFVLVGEFAYDC